jgi:hypothetical protein
MRTVGIEVHWRKLVYFSCSRKALLKLVDFPDLETCPLVKDKDNSPIRDLMNQV